MIEPPLQIHIVGAASDTAAPTEGTVGAAENTRRPYRGHGNRPYRGTLCRNTLGRAAGAAAPTEALEPPLQLTSVVVSVRRGGA